MKKIDNPSAVFHWAYQDALLGKGFRGTRDHIALQVQKAYRAAGIEFKEFEIPALIDDYMCEQGLAKPCSERITGLGDVVHAAVKLVDRVLGTQMASRPCSGCGKRRDEWNKLVPL